MKKIWKKINKIVLTIIIGGVLLLIIVLFAGKEMIRNWQSVLRNYKEQQQELTDTLAWEAKLRLEKNPRQELIRFLQESRINGSYRYCFLAKKEELLQVKDDTFYKQLQFQKITTVRQLQKRVKKEKKLITTAGFYGADMELYTIGIVTDEEAVVTNYKVTEHNMYLLLAMAFFCMIYICSVIFLLAQLHRRERQIAQLGWQLKQRQISLQNVSERVDWGEDMQLEKTAARPEYEDALVHALLRKSDQHKLLPLAIIYIKCFLKEHYVAEREWESKVDSLRKTLHPTQLLLLAAPGEIVILSYAADREKIDTFEKRLREQIADWQMQLHTDIALKSTWITKEHKGQIIKSYENLQESIRKGE